MLNKLIIKTFTLIKSAGTISAPMIPGWGSNIFIYFIINCMIILLKIVYNDYYIMLNVFIGIFNNTFEYPVEYINNDTAGSLDVYSGASGQINTSFNKNSTMDIEIKHSIEGTTVLGEGLKTIGNAINSYSMSAIIFATGVSTATIIKSLPPGASKATLAIALPSLVAVTSLFNNTLDNVFTNVNNNQSNNNNSAKDELEKLGLSNSKINDNIDYLNDYCIDSVYEELSKYDIIILVIIAYIGIGLYCLLAFTLTYVIKELKLESRQFIINRPLLTKIVKYYSTSNKVVSYLLLLLIWFSMLGAFVATIYLREYFSSN